MKILDGQSCSAVLSLAIIKSEDKPKNYVSLYSFLIYSNSIILRTWLNYFATSIELDVVAMILKIFVSLYFSFLFETSQLFPPNDN